MSISHLYYFVPKGETRDTASDIKKIPVSSDNLDPDKSKKKAKHRLRNLITSYSARNHWELDCSVSFHMNPPWDSPIRFRRELKNLGNTVSVMTLRESGDTLHFIYYERDQKDLLYALRRLYDKDIELIIEERDENRFVIYTQWKKEY